MSGYLRESLSNCPGCGEPIILRCSNCEDAAAGYFPACAAVVIKKKLFTGRRGKKLCRRAESKKSAIRRAAAKAKVAFEIALLNSLTTTGGGDASHTPDLITADDNTTAPDLITADDAQLLILLQTSDVVGAQR
jgi:hypothetical protein